MHEVSIAYDTHKMDILLFRADDFPLILRTSLSPDIDLLYIALLFYNIQLRHINSYVEYVQLLIEIVQDSGGANAILYNLVIFHDFIPINKGVLII